MIKQYTMKIGTLNMELFMDIMSSDIRRRILEKLAKHPDTLPISSQNYPLPNKQLKNT